MKRIQGLAVIVACGVLAGCASSPPRVASQDGLACTAQPQDASAVYIDIAYAADGMPAVASERCAVWPGTTLTWRNGEGDERAFEVVFKGEAPGRPLYERQPGVRYVATLTAPEVEVETEYTYGIRSAGHVLDPVIIIRPR